MEMRKFSNLSVLRKGLFLQGWVFRMGFLFRKQLLQTYIKNCNFEPFCNVPYNLCTYKKCVTYRASKESNLLNHLTVLLSMPLNKLPCASWKNTELFPESSQSETGCFSNFLYKVSALKSCLKWSNYEFYMYRLIHT